jgi:hypothetical protein
MRHPTNDYTDAEYRAVVAKQRLLAWKHRDPETRHSVIATFFEICAQEAFELRGHQHNLVIQGGKMSESEIAALEKASRDAERKIREASVFVFGYDIFDLKASPTLPPEGPQLG